MYSMLSHVRVFSEDLHQDPAQSEPSGWGQSDGGTKVPHQHLWHWTLGVVDHSASGTCTADVFLIIKQQNTFNGSLLNGTLICIPAGGGRKPCTEGTDLPLHQHRLFLPSLQSRSLAGTSRCPSHSFDLWPVTQDFPRSLHSNNAIMKCTSAGEKSNIAEVFTADCLNVCLDDNAYVERVCACVCVFAGSANAAPTASAGECCTSCAPGTPCCRQLDHAGTWEPEADRWRLAGVHSQPHWGRPAGHVQVLHIGSTRVNWIMLGKLLI